MLYGARGVLVVYATWGPNDRAGILPDLCSNKDELNFFGFAQI